MAFSPDGKRLASGSLDGTVKVWDATSGQETLTLKGHTEPVTSVAFRADGKRLASGSWDHSAKVWDAASGQEILTLKGHNRHVTSVAFSPDGTRLVSAAGIDQTVKVWDATSGQETLTLKGHTGDFKCVAFSPDGTRLASAGGHPNVSMPGELMVWDARPWTPELRAERLVRLLFDRMLSKPEVIEQIKSDKSVRDDVRQAALQIAKQWQIVPNDHVIFDAIWVKDVRNVTWECRHLLDAKTFEQKSKDRRTLSLAAFIGANSEPFFGGVWVTGDAPVSHVARFNLSKAEFQTEMQKLEFGFRLTSLDIYGSQEQQRYAALWTQSRDEAPWIMREELDQSDLLAENTKLKLDGYRPSVVTGYLTDDQTLKFVGVWIQDQEQADLEILSADEFKQRLAAPPSDVFPIWLNASGRAPSRTYAIIWSHSRPGTQWAISTSRGAMEFQSDFDAHVQRGFRPELLNAD